MINITYRIQEFFIRDEILNCISLGFKKRLPYTSYGRTDREHINVNEVVNPSTSLDQTQFHKTFAPSSDNKDFATRCYIRNWRSTRQTDITDI